MLVLADNANSVYFYLRKTDNEFSSFPIWLIVLIAVAGSIILVIVIFLIWKYLQNKKSPVDKLSNYSSLKSDYENN
jgi:hypothetical protein